MAIVLAGIAFMAIAPTDSLGHWFGLLAVTVGSPAVVMVSSKRVDGLQSVLARKWVNFRQTWVVGTVILASIPLALYGLHISALNGADEVWPVWLFVAAGLSGMAYWLYLTSRNPR